MTQLGYEAGGNWDPARTRPLAAVQGGPSMLPLTYTPPQSLLPTQMLPQLLQLDLEAPQARSSLSQTADPCLKTLEEDISQCGIVTPSPPSLPAHTTEPPQQSHSETPGREGSFHLPQLPQYCFPA